MKPLPRSFAEGLAGVAILVFGAWFLWQAGTLRQGPGYAAVGPRIFPLIVGLGILGSGLGVAFGAWRSRSRARGPAPAAGATGGEEREGGAGTDWPTLLAVAGLLVAYIALFQPLGFVIASTALLLVGARVLGSRAPLRDLAAGLAVSLAAYVLFTRFLGLEVPAGPLEAPLRAVLGGQSPVVGRQ